MYRIWQELISKYAFVSCSVLSCNLMKFQCSSDFLSVFYCVSALIRHFVFFSCWWPVPNGRYSHKIIKIKLPSISFPTKCIGLIMTGDKRRFGCRYSILDPFLAMFQIGHFGFSSILTHFFLVSDMLGGQVSEQKDAGALDKAKMPLNLFWQNCRHCILYCGRWFVYH